MSLNLRFPFDTPVHSTGDAVVPNPQADAYNEFDLMLLVVVTANQPTTLAVANGWAEETSFRIGIGTPGAAGAVGIQVFWKFASQTIALGGPGNAVTVADSGNHTVAFPYVYDWAGNGYQHAVAPFSSVSGATYASTSTLKSPAHTTRVANEHLFAIFANAVSSTLEQVTGETNASLALSTDNGFAQTTDGVGGGFDVGTGDKTVAGTFAADAWTGTVAWGTTNLAVIQIGITYPAAPPQGLHPELAVSSTGLGLTGGTGTLQYDPLNPSFNAAWSVVDDELASASLAFPDLRSIALVDEELVPLDAPPVTVAAAISSITATGLGATAVPGGVTTTAALATVTAAALAATDIPGAKVVATAVAAITAAGLGATAIPGAVSPAPAIAAITSAALSATAVAGAVTTAAAEAAATLTALGATAIPGAVAPVAALATITAAALAATDVVGVAVVATAVGAITTAALGVTAVPGAVAPAADVAAATFEALGAAGTSQNTVAAAEADITSEALGATAVPGSVTVTAALATITAAALAAQDIPGANTTATAVAAITAQGLAATAVPGGVTGEAEVAEATLAALSATPVVGAATAAAGIAGLELVALPVHASNTGSPDVTPRKDPSAGGAGGGWTARRTIHLPQRVQVAVADLQLQALPATAVHSAVVRADVAILSLAAWPATARSAARVEADVAWLVLLAEDAAAVARSVVHADVVDLAVRPLPAAALPGPVVVDVDYDLLLLRARPAAAIPGPVRVRADQADLFAVLPAVTARPGPVSATCDVAFLWAVSSGATARVAE